MKTLFLFLALMPCIAFPQVENVKYWDYNDVGWWTTTDNSDLTTLERGVEDEAIIVRFNMNSSINSRTWPLIITNKTEQNLTVKWMKSQIKGDRMVLGDMTLLTINNEIPDDIIYPGNKLLKEVSSIPIVNNPFLRPVYLPDVKKDFKKTKTPQYRKAEVILCIEINGDEKLYTFTLNAVYNGKRK